MHPHPSKGRHPHPERPYLYETLKRHPTNENKEPPPPDATAPHPAACPAAALRLHRRHLPRHRPLPGADSEATASLIGQPIQIGCIATSVEQQSPMAGEGGGQTRADGTTGTPATETGFPKVGTTITVFMTVPVRSSSAADGSSAEVRYSHANYTCTSVSTDGGTQAVTSATWQPTDPANLLRWEKDAAAYYFAAISPAIEMQPLEALTYTGSDGNSGGSYALQTGEAFTFQLPQAFTPENYAYWEQLRTSGLAVRIPQPTADPIPLQMQRALVKVDIFSTASAAVLLKAPAKAVFCAYTGGVTALREAPIVSNSTDGIHSYLFVDKLTDTRSVTTLSRDGAAVHRALMIPTYHQYSPDYLPLMDLLAAKPEETVPSLFLRTRYIAPEAQSAAAARPAASPAAPPATDSISPASTCKCRTEVPT